MAALPELPGWIGFDGPWAGSIHFVDYPENEEQDNFGPLEVLVVSREDKGGQAWLQEVRFLQNGVSGLPKPKKSNRLGLAPDGWLQKWINPESPFAFMDANSVDAILAKTMARRLLTGHLVALRFHELLMARQVLEDSAGSYEGNLKFVISKQDETITKATARLYKELTQWGEISSAMVIAELEGVSVLTVRNRLQSARKSGDLESPGSGARR
jgi:hypothetical protein